MAHYISTDFWTRAALTVAMIATLILSVLFGHVNLIAGITVMQVRAFKEVMSLRNTSSRIRNLQVTKTLDWYFLITTLYYLHGKALLYYFSDVIQRGIGSPMPLSEYHRFISLVLYVVGFMAFVRTLREESFREQFRQFAWIHIALFLVVLPGYFAMKSVLDGMIWFLLPECLVITNDIFAYLCGKAFGRTQLSKLSPKKTVEGFVGAWVATMLFGMGFTKLLTSSPYFFCPCNDLSATYWSGLSCTTDPSLLLKTYTLPSIASTNISFSIQPIYFHTMVLATIASLVATWGGFFASGVKRALQIKDFGDVIPGHGGVVDRVDCHLVMVVMAYAYQHAFVHSQVATAQMFVQAAIQGLGMEEKRILLNAMSAHLQETTMLPRIPQ